MEETNRERELEADPGEPELDEEQEEQQAVPAEPPLSDARDQPEDHQDEPGEDDEIAETGVEAEAVHEHVVVDRRSFVLELVRRIERAVSGKADLNDDHRKHDHRPRPIDSAHKVLPVADCARLRHCQDELKI